jgi:alpha-1,2-mannosyltransferase
MSRPDAPAAVGARRPSITTRLDGLVDAERMRNYSIALIASYGLAIAWTLLTARRGTDMFGAPVGADFIIFYASAKLAFAGKGALAYLAAPIAASEHAAVPGTHRLFLWCYPPPLQLLLTPLAALAYPAALAAWSVTGLIAYLGTLRLLSRDPRAWRLALAAPAAFLNLADGQTGFFVTAALGTGLLMHDRRPAVAGGAIGLLVFKPHFAVAAVVLLAVSRRWTTLFAAAITGSLLCLAATMVFGVSEWPAFWAAAAQAGRAFLAMKLPVCKSPSLLAALLCMGAPAALALTLHALAAVAALVLAAAEWRRPGSPELRAGLAVLATLIALPYSFDYDLVLLVIPIGAALTHARRHGAPAGLLAAMTALALTPLVLPFAQGLARLPLGPAMMWLGFAYLLRLNRDPAGPSSVTGAVEKTRTSTGCPTATSTLRVYQFRHDRPW